VELPDLEKNLHVITAKEAWEIKKTYEGAYPT